MPQNHSAIMRATRAEWFKRTRKDRKLTQGQLAERVGVTTNAISQFEKGSADPSLDTLDRLLVALEIWWVDLHVPLDSGPPPHRDVPRPFLTRSHYLTQQVIDEFCHPTRKPAQYPARMRCWCCHLRPGECECWYQCKVCRLPYHRNGKCSGILH